LENHGASITLVAHLSPRPKFLIPPAYEFGY